MTSADLIPLVPLMIISGGSVLVLLVIAFARNHGLTFGITLLLFAGALVSLPWVAPVLPRHVTSLLILDSYALFYLGLLFTAGLAVTLMSYSYLEKQGGNREEFYLLILTATSGSAILVSSSHFASFLLGLEILSVSLYVLIAYPRTVERSIEGGVKYLILAAVSAALLFFGMALVYADLGTMEFGQIISMMTSQEGNYDLILMTGVVLIIVGIGFKLAVVPFHMWTPDIYEGAPAPATAFIASVSKGGMFALLLRYFTPMHLQSYRSLFILFSAIAIASMLIGNLLALMQHNIKRLLAYSSIGHLGYLLVAFLASGTYAVSAVAYYLAAYFVSILAAFGIVTVLSRPDGEADDLEEYRGLYWRRPWIAAIFTTALLSLASIPLTAGFFGKFWIFAAGIRSSLWLLVFVLVVSSGIGLYYYLRVVVVMSEPPKGPAVAVSPALSFTGGLILAVLTIMVIWLGIFPAPIVALIESTVARIM